MCRRHRGVLRCGPLKIHVSAKNVLFFYSILLCFLVIYVQEKYAVRQSKQYTKAAVTDIFVALPLTD